MNHHECDVIHVPRHLKGDAVEVLTAAFWGYPLMRHVFSPDETGYVESLRAMFTFSDSPDGPRRYAQCTPRWRRRHPASRPAQARREQVGRRNI